MAAGFHDFVRERAPFGDQCKQMFAIGAVARDGKPGQGGRPSAAPFGIEKQIVGDQRIQIGTETTRHDRELPQRDLIRERLDHEVKADEGIIPIEG